MTLSRRVFLLTASAAGMAVSRGARAETYPARPVRIIAGYPPGGIVDTYARLTAAALSERLGQQFIVENRVGAGSNIATELVAREQADGYTLLLVTQSNAVSAALYPKLNFDFLRDIAPVAGIMRGPLVLLVHPAVPAKTVPELIAFAKAHPGRLNMASGGNGTSLHVAGELFKMMAGIEMVHVPYRGVPYPDLLEGRVQVMFAPIATCLGYIRDGKLRALAVTTAARSPALPDVPAVAESVPGYEAGSWYGLGAPRNTPAPLVGKLNAEINAALADSVIKAQFVELGAEPMPMTPASFGDFIADETAKWGRVVKVANVRVD
jgi:tripartite-type tricarboxylate transporter receptor subunit TctC